MSNPIAPFAIDFSLMDGRCKSGKAEPTHRFVKNMASQFLDSKAAEAIG